MLPVLFCFVRHHFGGIVGEFGCTAAVELRAIDRDRIALARTAPASTAARAAPALGARARFEGRATRSGFGILARARGAFGH